MGRSSSPLPCSTLEFKSVLRLPLTPPGEEIQACRHFGWFISSFTLVLSLVLSLRRGHTLSRSSSPKMGPLTLVQTLFNAVNAFTKHSKIYYNPLLLREQFKYFYQKSSQSPFQIFKCSKSEESTAQFKVWSSSDQ